MIHSKITTADYNWIRTEQLTPTECTQLQQTYDLTSEMITYVTDKDESPNYVYDSDTADQLFIVHVPYTINMAQLRYITRPISFIIHQGTLFTFNESGLDWVDQIFTKVQQNSEIKTADHFILQTLFALMDSYIGIVKAITKKRNQLDQTLNKEAKNTDLIALSYLRQTLTFFLGAVQFNLNLLRHLPRTHFGLAIGPAKQEVLDDVTIEAEQVQWMIDIETQVVDRIGDTFDSIVNNNLNDTMKILTIWSLTMAVPTIITGFYGMNVHLPLAKLGGAWLLTIGVSLVLIVWLLIALKLHHKM
ncbi:magnesium transporter CorA family protein [Loigolactobacillus zhaoyuanensis]|uniref:Magnesium transporter CorA family protein n=1 Tax=Loigolactobacillus zhaoyuanensis TaxID=2486017 RepID=A0ABW8UDB5_9LACO|nr:magnesium transporter CorA family protein [Loigolactobacillus zhaoyuanensis]